MRKKYHLGDQPIPTGFRIYEERLEVLGVQRRRADALAFCHGRGQSLAFVLEPSNPHDANAIRIDGAWKGWLFSKQKQLGYVPREIAARLAETGLAATVRPRLPGANRRQHPPPRPKSRRNNRHSFRHSRLPTANPAARELRPGPDGNLPLKPAGRRP